MNNELEFLMKTRGKILALSTAALMAAAPMASFAQEAVNGAEIINEQALDANATIADNAMKVQNLTTLISAVKAAGLADELMGEGPYTLFAPTNAAFSKLPAGAVDELLKPENREMLQDVINAHLIEGEFTPQMIDDLLATDSSPERVAIPDNVQVDYDNNIVTLTTVSGDPIRVEKGTGEELILRDAAGNIVTTLAKDVEQSNGVMYFVDGVLMPVS
ncbi:fasciclin domain-containing protein [Celeribacter sp. HF31]|uniref:fasciclin domain-containing protein n=1 Tax=Celeribacter sp. HF31 TaxID=2721558 RepID=UPI0014311E89|nr:fasciclin domain-containing protein [Celeribacter sp. HF31]NIY78573.1 fasciclin domain-containing protein [Celeribacter sp. HF31]